MAPLSGYCGYEDCVSCVENLCFFVEFLNRTLNCEPTIENLDNVRDWTNTTAKCPSPNQDDQECARFDLLGCSLFIIFLGLGIIVGFLAGKYLKMPGQYERLRDMDFEAWRQRGARVINWIRLTARWLGVFQRISTCCIRVGDGLLDNEVHAVEDPVVPVEGPRPPNPPPPPPPPAAAAISPPAQQQVQVPGNHASSPSTESISSDDHQDQDRPQDQHAPQDQDATQDQEANEDRNAAGNIAGNLPQSPTVPASSSTPLVPLIPPPGVRRSQESHPSRIPVAMKSYGSTHARSSSGNEDTQEHELRRSSRTKARPQRLSYSK